MSEPLFLFTQEAQNNLFWIILGAGILFVLGIVAAILGIGMLLTSVADGFTKKGKLVTKCTGLIKKWDKRVKKMQQLSFLPDTFRIIELKPVAQEISQLLQLDFTEKSEAELEIYIKKLATTGEYIEQLEKKALIYA